MKSKYLPPSEWIWNGKIYFVRMLLMDFDGVRSFLRDGMKHETCFMRMMDWEDTKVLVGYASG